MNSINSVQVMIDTNVFIDTFLKRPLFYKDSSYILDLSEWRDIKGYTTTSCITDMYYIVRHNLRSHQAAHDVLGKLFLIAEIYAVTPNNIYEAYDRNGNDFEDTLLMVCAESLNCDYIITRNTKDFMTSSIPAVTPAEFISEVI